MCWLYLRLRELVKILIFQKYRSGTESDFSWKMDFVNAKIVHRKGELYVVISVCLPINTF